MARKIAIVGSACRFPGSTNSTSALWELLRAPKDILSTFRPDQLNFTSLYNDDANHHGSTNVQNQSYLLAEDTRLFDAPFFNISPVEADEMDPQQRILLETVYEALESAGCTLHQIQGSMTSVYAGLMNGDFGIIQERDLETLPTYNSTGTARSILSNRVSYFFDLRGPSLTIDTACSSSLVALHQAVQSLRNGECQMAIVGGANLMLDPTVYVAESKLHMLSPDSRSRMWDSAANGYARGEGFAAVVLKPLDHAISNSDHIECVIAGTAVNSDGRSKGLTVPRASAQTSLIRQAYRDAGLDPEIDRCQFFEAHGTGTPAGDPVEARAIRDAFFPRLEDPSRSEKLLVGSIKTVVGHLEGCAGLAGVLKASLAIQNRTIPPNLHFNNLSPGVAPFYARLEVPTEPRHWPATQGMPLRASVNSFGFGGTNAHVVLESFDSGNHYNHQPLVQSSPENERFIGPLTFSANSKGSLLASVRAHAEYIRDHKQLDLSDLSWTLQKRRSVFGHRAFFSGETRQKLLSNMEAFSSEAGSTDSGSSTLSDPSPANLDGPAVLGIFTGQGAQWASMGRSLMTHCRLFRESIEQCEASLRSLGSDMPDWSLRAELLAEEDSSRIKDAEISQPLCTALQIATVDLLRACGIKFRAVVGHSAGEIAAAYAAGLISAHDAIRIAYYKGFHARLSKGANSRAGGMLAVGISHESASQFCAEPAYKDRICVAAVNAPTSVTLSGDMVAIDEAKAYFDDEKIFARKLNVDTAYHSHHMQPSSTPYLQSLKACRIQVRECSEDCRWFSSVFVDDELCETGLETLSSSYWNDNLLNPVLFAPAVENALATAGPFDMVIEVGPHPALKGPTTQILKSALGSSLPYSGTLRRGVDAIEAFSGGIGYFWEYFGAKSSIDFDGYRNAFAVKHSRPPRLVKGLPSYSWNHSRVHWKESRISRNLRLRDNNFHLLLGRRSPDDSRDLIRWRNILRPNEIPWVRNHVFQGQIILPGASYVSAIVEAVKVLANGKPMRLVEMFDLEVPKAVILQENQSCELTTTLQQTVAGPTSKDDQVLSANFTFHLVSDESTAIPERTCSGRVVIHLGDEADNELLARTQLPPNLNPVDIESFYDSLLGLGLNYQGPFRGMKAARRTLNFASASASWDASEISDSCTVHPAILDVAFHAIFAAFASPSSGRMWTPYLPVGIRRASIVPQLCQQRGSGQVDVDVNAVITASSASSLEGDLQILFGEHVGVQVEGLQLRAALDPNVNADRHLFSRTVWEADISTGIDVRGQHFDQDNENMVDAMERVALFYYQRLLEEISTREINNFAWHHQLFIQTAKYHIDRIRSGGHPSAKRSWLEDSRDVINDFAETYKDCIDLILMRALGENLPAIVRGEKQILEVMMENDMLNRFYMEGTGFRMLNQHIARAFSQLAHRYPRARILEIGAGTGGTTRKIFDTIGNAYDEYVYTDISAGFFEKAAEKFSDHRNKMTFKTLDVEKDTEEQGYTDATFDIIVAANVLHATTYLEQTMRHVRRLLKPGGHLILMEVTGDLLRIGFIMGGLSGWWLGPQIGDAGRQYGPGISPVQWEDLLHATHFSGVDFIVHDMPDSNKHTFSMITSQAVDEAVSVLRNPLSHLNTITVPERLFIIGGETLPVAKLLRDVKKILSTLQTTIITASSIDNLQYDDLETAGRSSVISFTELDQPLFAKKMTAARFSKLQMLLAASDSILWVTAGCKADSPASNVFVGIARGLWTERNDINLQILDIGSVMQASPTVLVESFLRLTISKSPDYEKRNILWTTEPELALDSDTLLIPRVVSDTNLNDRYNAGRHTIEKQVYSQSSTIELSVSGGLVSLLSAKKILQKQSSSDQVALNVRLSICLPFERTKYFVCYGTVGQTSQLAFALSTTNQSTITANARDILLVDKAPAQEALTLIALASQIVARSLLTKISGSALLVYDPEEALARAISHCALGEDRVVFFATSKPEPAVPAGWIHVRQHALASFVKRELPAEIDSVLDFSSKEARDLRPLLPVDCVFSRFEASFLELGSNKSAPHDILAHAFADSVTATQSTVPASTVPIHGLHGTPSSAVAYPNVVDWSSEEPIKTVIKPLRTSNLFSSTKTHLLVGMTGDLGQSICRFMIQNGARHIAITSRRGKVDHTWLDSVQQHGSDVKVYKMDVTSRESIKATHEEILSTMPPIGGVCNAAMVLQDKLFMDMDVEMLNNTLGPKVDGSRNLDELFAEATLDYFVLFSSVATVAGNGGQTNYHAANMFMTSLVENRRRRGLAASVMHVGMVVDVGYVARAGRHLEEYLRKLFYAPLSESDAHQLFAEAVAASPVESDINYDICMGLEPFKDRPDAKSRPPWYSNPRFARFISKCEEDLEDRQVDAADSVPIRQQLDEAENPEAAHSMLLAAFSSKLEAMMQLDSGSISLNVPLLDLGFDSLLAVEVRTWFLKEVRIDVPVLKLLRGDTLSEICRDAASLHFEQRAVESRSDPTEPTARSRDAISEKTADAYHSIAVSDTMNDIDSSSKNDQSSSSGSDRLDFCTPQFTDSNHNTGGVSTPISSDAASSVASTWGTPSVSKPHSQSPPDT